MTVESLQLQLANSINAIYNDAVVKKIDTDNFLDIYIPSINSSRGTHLYFNTSKDGIKIGFYVRDESFINDVLLRAANSIEAASNGLRLIGNPKFDDVDSAIAAAVDFLSAILNEKLSQQINTSKKQVAEVPEIEEINQDLIDAFLEIYGNDDLSEFLENYLVDGEIVVLTIQPEDFIAAVKDDTGYSDLVNTLGSVGIDSWSDLAELIGEKEANKAKKEYKDEDPGGIVLFYCNGNYVYAFSNPKEADFGFDHDELIEDDQSLKLDEDTIPQILAEINRDKNLKHIQITYYTKDYSDLNYSLVYKVNNSNVQVNRVNWYNDSYWKSELERSEFVEGLEKYYEGQINVLELIDEYLYKGIVEYEFAGVGDLGNGLDFQVTDLDDLTDIPENLQDEDGNLDVWALSNEIIPEEEDLYEDNVGKIYSYTISLNGKTYELISDELNKDEIQEVCNFSEFDIDDLELISKASTRIENEKVLTGLLYIPNKLVEMGFDEVENPFFFTSLVHVSEEEDPGFLLVNAAGFHSDCYTENEIKFIFSWDTLINIRIVEEDAISIKIELIKEDGSLLIHEPYSKNLKVLLSIYNSIWKDVVLRFAAESEYDWDIIQNDMGVSISTFDSQDEYVNWITEYNS
jgi:hypothetical protein